MLGPKTQVKEKGWASLPYAAPSFSPGPRLPPTHNEQLVENLHFMKIGLKNKGVSLYCPALPPWPIWVLSPPWGNSLVLEEEGPLLFLADGQLVG